MPATISSEFQKIISSSFNRWSSVSHQMIYASSRAEKLASVRIVGAMQPWPLSIEQCSCQCRSEGRPKNLNAEYENRLLKLFARFLIRTGIAIRFDPPVVVAAAPAAAEGSGVGGCAFV